MHELSVVGPIIKIAERVALDNNVERIKAVHLAVGELHDLDEQWAAKYFERYSRNTRLEGAELKIRKIPICFHCRDCGTERIFTHFTFVNTGVITCEKCGKEMPMITGKEMRIEGIECAASNEDE